MRPGPEPLPAESVALPSRPNGERILLVDDDEAVRRVVERMLRLLGFDVQSVASGEEAAALVRVDPSFEAAVVDLVMPGANGPQTLLALREAVPSLGCVLISGFDVESLDYELPCDERTSFLGKPFRKEALVESLLVVLAGARSDSAG